jgi:hypothetical protein
MTKDTTEAWHHSRLCPRFGSIFIDMRVVSWLNLRPTVIARKVSFGSSSDAGSRTRSILMSVLHTLNKRRTGQSLESVFKGLLDELAKNPKTPITPLFPKPNSP